jgi:glycosyltransferase involved in cell wall biosynthesis
MATLGRSDEIVLLIESLINQTYKDFELIIVDQNDDDRVYNIYSCYKDRIDIKYFKSDIKGLSLNRNIGLKNCTGDIIAFPDDDCEYKENTLESTIDFFTQHPKYNFCTCNTREKTSDNTILKSKKYNSKITLFNVMNVGISFTIFIRQNSIKDFKFDEKLGVGTIFGSGEESDLLFFLIKNHNRGYYHATSYIYHPYKPEDTERSFSYGRGCGAVYKKAVTKYKFYILLPIFILRIIKGMLNILFYSNKKERIASLQGRIQGFIQYK